MDPLFIGLRLHIPAFFFPRESSPQQISQHGIQLKFKTKQVTQLTSAKPGKFVKNLATKTHFFQDFKIIQFCKPIVCHLVGKISLTPLGFMLKPMPHWLTKQKAFFVLKITRWLFRNGLDLPFSFPEKKIP